MMLQKAVSKSADNPNNHDPVQVVTWSSHNPAYAADVPDNVNSDVIEIIVPNAPGMEDKEGKTI